MTTLECSSLVLFGCLVMQLFSLNTDQIGSIEFLKKMFPTWSHSRCQRADFLIFLLTGTIVGQILFDPKTHIAAFMAGIGWVGALKSLALKASSRKRPVRPNNPPQSGTGRRNLDRGK